MDDASRLAQLADDVAARVPDGARLGLGSGSTTEAFIRALGHRMRQDRLHVSGVPTSERTARLAREVGLTLTTLNESPHLDLGVDGADEIDPLLGLVKGRGGALLYEKIVALSCDRYIIVAASEKLVEQLGSRIRLPVEVIPFGWERTARRIQRLGLEPELRSGTDGQPFLTDGGHYVLDCATAPLDDPMALAAALKAQTGVVEHGLFIGMATMAVVIDQRGIVSTLTPQPVS